MRAKENCCLPFFCRFTICFAVVPCILQLCFFCRCANLMYHSYVQFCWCANEIAVVLFILQLCIQFVSCELFLPAGFCSCTIFSLAFNDLCWVMWECGNDPRFCTTAEKLCNCNLISQLQKIVQLLFHFITAKFYIGIIE